MTSTDHMNGLLMVGNAAAVIPEGESWVEGVDVNPIAHTYTPEDREFIAAARTAVPWLLEQVELRDEALNAVLKLHKPVQATTTNSNGGVSDITICDHCLDPTWPCPTVTAITTPLEGKSDD